MQTSNHVNIAVGKLATTNLTVVMLSRNFKETVQQFIASPEAFSLMNTRKGTPVFGRNVCMTFYQ